MLKTTIKKLLDKLTLKHILFYGFLVLYLVGFIGAYSMQHLLGQASAIVDHQRSIHLAYDAADRLKLNTEYLLSARDPLDAYANWHASAEYAQTQLEALLKGSDHAEDELKWTPVWNKLEREIKVLKERFATKALTELFQARKPLLSFVGQTFDSEDKSELYARLTSLVDQIEYTKQFEGYLIDSLSQLSKDHVHSSDAQINHIRSTIIKIVAFSAVFMLAFTYLLITMVRRTQDRLMNTQLSLSHALDGLRTNQQELVKNRDSMNFLAHHDELTDLPNRRYLLDYTETAINAAQQTQQKIALIFIDLDRFKEINDSLGHSVGDRVLIELAKRMKKITPDNCVLSRIGGDEFTFVCVQEQQNIAQLKSFAKAIIKTVSNPIRVNKLRLQVTCSIGICVYPESAANAEILLRNADSAMYSAKHQGKNNFQFYSENLTLQAQKRVELELQLRRAMRESAFELLYQPQYHLKTQELVGWEALLRCRDDKGNYLLPSDFIPIAEEVGLIYQISLWVFTTAAEQMVAWRKAGLATGRMAINLSGALLTHSSFLEDVQKIMVDTNCKPEWIELEITEGHLMNYPQDVIELLSKFKKMGFSIAIDDFGTGYSSLAALKTLPINKIKIDKSFLVGVPKDLQKGEILRTLVYMAKALKLELLAEGVEYQAQVAFLKKAGCHHGQGYLLGYPTQADEQTLVAHQSKRFYQSAIA